LVFLCTLIGAAAQLLIKEGAGRLPRGGLAGLLSNLSSLLTNFPLIAGYVCLAVMTALMIAALRNGHLSVLYPIIALTYVWVMILSALYLGDHLNSLKVAGVVLIVGGVSLIGIGSRR
jgi:uncharacterized membrane protein